jgi:hypothetical protein
VLDNNDEQYYLLIVDSSGGVRISNSGGVGNTSGCTLVVLKQPVTRNATIKKEIVVFMLVTLLVD